MQGVNASVYLRVPFDVDDPGTVDELIFRIKYDDGYVFYLNGDLIDVQNGPFLPTFIQQPSRNETTPKLLCSTNST